MEAAEPEEVAAAPAVLSAAVVEDPAVPVAAVEALVPVLVLVLAAPVLDAAVEQLAMDATVAPLALQIPWAKAIALAWSAASQASTRQQLIAPRKPWSLQMHSGSVPQPW